MKDPKHYDRVVEFSKSTSELHEVFMFDALGIKYYDVDTSKIEEDERLIGEALENKNSRETYKLQALGILFIQELHGAMEDIDKFIDTYGNSDGEEATPDIFIVDDTGKTLIFQRPRLKEIGGSVTDTLSAASGEDYPCSVTDIQLTFVAEMVTLDGDSE